MREHNQPKIVITDKLSGTKVFVSSMEQAKKVQDFFDAYALGEALKKPYRKPRLSKI